MGVRGLQAFLKENRQSLCDSVHFPSTREGSSAAPDRTPIVVDAWGIIYQLYLDSLPWCSGGEYLRFYRLVRRLIEAWRKVGLEPTFVFDGSAPSEKHDTLLGRIRQQYKTSLLFHTTSISSRSSPSFSRSSTILPPFTSQTFIHALHSLKVSTYFAPIGEADGICVTLANQLGGYVLGLDSDFLILVSSPNASQVKGYCPLDMFMWIQGATSQTAIDTAASEAPDGWSEWSQAKPRRSPAPTRQSSFLPPAHYTSPTLVLTSISPSALRSRFRLPASVLPLLASLVGNDYTPSHFTETIFENSLSVVQRIEKVARVLRETVFGPAARAGTTAGDQAVDMVQKVIRKLAVRGTVSDSHLQEMVDAIIESTFQYILPSVPDHPSTYPFTQTPRMADWNDQMDEDHLAAIERAKEGYAILQRKGMAPSLTHSYLYPGRVYIWPILEDPSGPSLRASDRLRGVRREAWTVLEQGCGGLCWPEPTEEEVRALREDKELQELLGVVEEIEATTNEDEDAEDDTDASEDDASPASSQTASPSAEVTLVDGISEDGAETENPVDQLRAVRPRVIVEHVRQGSSQRIVETTVPLPPVPAVPPMPPCLGPLETRLERYLETLSSDTPKSSTLPARLHPLIAITRCTILEISDRSGSRPDPKLRGHEVSAILKMGLGMLAGWEKEERTGKFRKDVDEGAWPQLGVRQSSIVAQVGAVMIEGLLLAQSLLLTPEAGHDDPASGPSEEKREEDLDTRLTHLTPFMFFSGVALHHLLSHSDPPSSTGWRWGEPQDELLAQCIEAAMEGLEEAVVGWTNGVEQPAPAPPALAQTKREKKDKKKKKSNAGSASQMAGSRFDLLNSLED
ncbi:hypothetical protein DB88DRAFT_498897 [Papiliotrema laurentii]|uniref:Asteroid domain-containing protein n=1 Tax=Papiliotrema laurentii TaxID=5418 RepID=A0AAD9CTL5_PAPLA|nr:hypothetical protein DB88DRAFT_498897 [Papiliotrema laurentii]